MLSLLTEYCFRLIELLLLCRRLKLIQKQLLCWFGTMAYIYGAILGSVLKLRFVLSIGIYMNSIGQLQRTLLIIPIFVWRPFKLRFSNTFYIDKIILCSYDTFSSLLVTFQSHLIWSLIKQKKNHLILSQTKFNFLSWISLPFTSFSCAVNWTSRKF